MFPNMIRYEAQLVFARTKSKPLIKMDGNFLETNLIFFKYPYSPSHVLHCRHKNDWKHEGADKWPENQGGSVWACNWTTPV